MTAPPNRFPVGGAGKLRLHLSGLAPAHNPFLRLFYSAAGFGSRKVMLPPAALIASIAAAEAPATTNLTADLISPLFKIRIPSRL
jgi:hypothetical protein